MKLINIHVRNFMKCFLNTQVLKTQRVRVVDLV